MNYDLLSIGLVKASECEIMIIMLASPAPGDQPWPHPSLSKQWPSDIGHCCGVECLALSVLLPYYQCLLSYLGQQY